MQVGFIITNKKCLKDGANKKILLTCPTILYQHTSMYFYPKCIPPTQNTNSLGHTFCWSQKQTKTHTHTYTPTHSGKHKNQPSGSKFHFISRFSKEQAGESIHAISSCAEGGLAAMETDVAPLQTAALIQSTGVNTQAHGDGGWALLLPWLENTIAK